MSYTINELGKLAGITVRTLHHYDNIGLLSPAGVKKNGYRFYEENELLKLQQILFFRELEFPLLEIKRIMNDKNFNMEAALNDQKKLIELHKQRLTSLIETINKTINKINKKTKMEDKELYDGLSKEKMEEYAKEAKERWGNTDAYKQSQERYAKMSKDDLAKIKKAGEDLLKEIAAVMDKGVTDPIVQALIARHYDGLRAFYEPNMTMYRGLGAMYADDPRFSIYFDKFAPGLSVFMKEAIAVYCDNN